MVRLSILSNLLCNNNNSIRSNTARSTRIQSGNISTRIQPTQWTSTSTRKPNSIPLQSNKPTKNNSIRKPTSSSSSFTNWSQTYFKKNLNNKWRKKIFCRISKHNPTTCAGFNITRKTTNESARWHALPISSRIITSLVHFTFL